MSVTHLSNMPLHGIGGGRRTVRGGVIVKSERLIPIPKMSSFENILSHNNLSWANFDD